MIVLSLLLIVVAAGLLVVGLIQGANALLTASIALSLLAAVILVVAGRRAAGRATAQRAAAPGQRTDQEELEVGAEEARRSRRAERLPVGAGVGAGGGGASSSLDETSVMAPVSDTDPYGTSIPQQGSSQETGRSSMHGAMESVDEHHSGSFDAIDSDDDDYEDEPEDEPAAQQTSPAEAARVKTLHTEVFVIDGRPRYHIRGCVHLLGRDSEPLPVSEAVDLGFTPCGVCEPDSALVADAARRG